MMHNCWLFTDTWCLNIKRMEIYNVLYCGILSTFWSIDSKLWISDFRSQFPKRTGSTFNSTPAVRTLPRIGGGGLHVYSLRCTFSVRWVPALFAFAYHCPISDQFHGQQQKHLINVLVLVLILENQPQQGKKEFGLYSVQSLEIPSNISRPMSFPF